MAPVPTSGHSSVPPLVDLPYSGSAASSPPSPERRRLAVLLASLPLLHLSNPLAWGESGLGLWYPPAGLGLALIAWFGPRAALWVVLDALLVVTQRVLGR